MSDALNKLSGWVGQTAAIGMRLPDDTLEVMCTFVRKHRQHLILNDELKLRKTFEAWQYLKFCGILALKYCNIL